MADRRGLDRLCAGGDIAQRFRRTPPLCIDLAAYVSQVASARGKSIPVATADALIAKAQHIRLVLGC